MKHKKKIVAGFFTGIFIIVFAWGAPFLIRQDLQTMMEKIGFPHASFGSIKISRNGLFIDRISFDNDIEAKDVTIDGALSTLIFKGKAEKISIQSLDISGLNLFPLSDWKKKLGTFSAGFEEQPFQSLYINAIAITVDTQSGPLHLMAKASLDPSPDGSTILNASMLANEEKLKADINVKAFNRQKAWAGTVDINEGRVDLASLTVSRISGWVEFNTKNKFSVAGQIVSGGLKFNQVAFGESNLIFDSTKSPMAALETRAAENGVSLNAELPSSDSKISIKASAPHLSDLVNLVSVQDQLFLRSDPVAITGYFDPEAPEAISFNAFDARLADGHIRMQPFRYSLSQPQNDFLLFIDHLNGQKFIDSDKTFMSLNGTISGVIPLTVSHGKIEIKDGIVSSDQPGSFQYNPPKLSAYLEPYRSTLKNYRYQSFETILNGKLGGNVHAVFTAKGQDSNLKLNLDDFLFMEHAAP